MKAASPISGLAVVALAALCGIAHGQAVAPPAPPPPPVRVVNTLPPPSLPLPPSKPMPATTLPEVAVVPLPEKATPVKANTLPDTPEADFAVKDFHVDPKEGQTASNPTGRQEPGLSMEWLYPTTVRLGQPVTCTLIVKSLSTNRLQQVVVRQPVPVGATIQATEPKATQVGDLLVWQMGNFEPRQERRIDIRLLPTAKGSLPCQAFVTFTGSSTANLQVREPKLALKTTMPQQILSGDVATLAVTVSNPGDAKVDRVKVHVGMTDGLAHGASAMTDFDLEGLGANESRTVLVQCLARAVGPQGCTAVATAIPGLEARSTSNVVVVAPKLEVVAGGPKMRYLDRHAVYSFKVVNSGTAPANHVMVSDLVPVGFKVVSATNEAHHDAATRTVVWFLGDVPAGQSKEVSVDLMAINPGEYKNEVTVTASRGLRAVSDVFTRVEGLPGLQMELVDLEDPVEIGKEVSYEIRLSNTGTKTETNLQVICTMPDKMEFRGAKCNAGVQAVVQGREIVFGVIPKLAPRADIIYRVNVRSQAAGDVRFHARVRADGLATPVVREESTRVFGDEREK